MNPLKSAAQKLMKGDVINYLSTQHIIKPVITDFIKRKNAVVYGGKAINAQSSFPDQRYSKDFDIYVKDSPKKSAEQLDNELDNARNGNYHYVKPARHRGTYKVRDIGIDLKKGTDDDSTLADFTRKPKKLKTRNIMGINYAALSEIKKSKLAVVKNPKYSFRHEKDIKDIQAIKRIQRGFFR